MGKGHQVEKHFMRNQAVTESWWDTARGIGSDVQEWKLPFIKDRKNDQSAPKPALWVGAQLGLWCSELHRQRKPGQNNSGLCSWSPRWDRCRAAWWGIGHGHWEKTRSWLWPHLIAGMLGMVRSHGMGQSSVLRAGISAWEQGGTGLDDGRREQNGWGG